MEAQFCFHNFERGMGKALVATLDRLHLLFYFKTANVRVWKCDKKLTRMKVVEKQDIQGFQGILTFSEYKGHYVLYFFFPVCLSPPLTGGCSVHSPGHMTSLILQRLIIMSSTSLCLVEIQ